MSLRPRLAAPALVVMALALSCSSGERPPALQEGEGEGGGSGAAGDAGTGGPTNAGVVVSEATLSNWEAETFLAIAPGGDALAVWIGLGLGGGRVVGFATSNDAGASWGKAGVVPADPAANAVDPSVTVDAQGRFHVAWLELPKAGGQRRIMTARFLGDIAFTIPVDVSGPLASSELDKPWVAASDDGGLVIVYGGENGSSIRAATSADGVSWATSSISPDGTLRNVAFPCTTGSRTYVAYLIPGGVELVGRPDPSSPWSSPVRVDDPAGGTAFEPPSCVARGEEVWVAYGTGGGSGSSLETPLLDDVWVAHVRGESVERRRASEPISGLHYLLPFLTRDAAGLALTYYAATKDGREGSFRAAFASDEGAWGGATTVQSPVLVTTRRGGFDWLGDYAGAQFHQGTLVSAFADNLGTPGALLSHVRVTRVARP